MGIFYLDLHNHYSGRTLLEADIECEPDVINTITEEISNLLTKRGIPVAVKRTEQL